MIVQTSCESYGKGALEAFTTIKKVKQTKYRFLQRTIERLSADAHTSFKPKFLLPCITTDGLMDADMAEVIKFMGNQYAKMLTKQGPRLGLSTQTGPNRGGAWAAIWILFPEPNS